MNCQITERFFSVVDTLLDAEKNPVDYGTGQLLYHAEISFLNTIRDHTGIKVSVLAGHMGVTKGAATQMAAKLSEKGLLEIYQQEGNKKEKFYRLTPQGEVACKGHEQYHEIANKNLCAYFCSLNEEQTNTIIDFLEHLQTCVPFSDFKCRNNHQTKG